MQLLNFNKMDLDLSSITAIITTVASVAVAVIAAIALSGWKGQKLTSIKVELLERFTYSIFEYEMAVKYLFSVLKDIDEVVNDCDKNYLKELINYSKSSQGLIAFERLKEQSISGNKALVEMSNLINKYKLLFPNNYEEVLDSYKRLELFYDHLINIQDMLLTFKNSQGIIGRRDLPDWIKGSDLTLLSRELEEQKAEIISILNEDYLALPPFCINRKDT